MRKRNFSKNFDFSLFLNSDESQKFRDLCRLNHQKHHSKSQRIQLSYSIAEKANTLISLLVKKPEVLVEPDTADGDNAEF
jgi:hypothetical protein